MRVILVGASGTIGREVAKILQDGHDVVTPSRSSGELQVYLAAVTGTMRGTVLDVRDYP